MTSTALAHLAGDQLPARDSVGETAVSAASSQAKAATEARYMVAMHRPRSVDTVRVEILTACKRPGFAATARYAKPVGNSKVVGPSIRFAEEAGRCLGNLLVETPTLYDDDEKRLVRVVVTDLESNLSYSADITLAKTIERKFLKKGQTAISTRLNSNGEPTYLVEATEDDLLTKQQAIVSKHIRNGILRILPGDILEEAMAQVVATLKDTDAQDPAAARKKLVDAFFELGVGPDRLVQYLAHPLEEVSPAELGELRTVYQALKEGEANWSAIMEAKYGETNGESNGRGTQGLKDRLEKKKGKKGDVELSDEESAELDRKAAAE